MDAWRLALFKIFPLATNLCEEIVALHTSDFSVFSEKVYDTLFFLSRFWLSINDIDIKEDGCLIQKTGRFHRTERSKN